MTLSVMAEFWEVGKTYLTQRMGFSDLHTTWN